ncbi:hypothetical protein LXA43DRAFT_981270 [Ganoderma leucocontextum]|nr:hypothetical protein LXA43DRAFT_981270 [Ganoderma leucocontextum]
MPWMRPLGCLRPASPLAVVPGLSFFAVSADGRGDTIRSGVRRIREGADGQMHRPTWQTLGPPEVVERRLRGSIREGERTRERSICCRYTTFEHGRSRERGWFRGGDWSLAIAAARGARCNQTLTFFRQAGARLTPPRPPPSPLPLPPSTTSLVFVRALTAHLASFHQSILSISHLSPRRIHHDPRPRGTSTCLYHSTLHILPFLVQLASSLLRD